jgi:hypothetical protein
VAPKASTEKRTRGSHAMTKAKRTRALSRALYIDRDDNLGGHGEAPSRHYLRGPAGVCTAILRHMICNYAKWVGEDDFDITTAITVCLFQQIKASSNSDGVTLITTICIHEPRHVLASSYAASLFSSHSTAPFGWRRSTPMCHRLDTKFRVAHKASRPVITAYQREVSCC